MTAPRLTVSSSITWQGLGLHSGIPGKITLNPGQEGIVFRQEDRRWPAHPSQVTQTDRRTMLGGVSTVEHLLSALNGLGITDAEIEVDGPELPALDGSAAHYVAAIQEVGTESCGYLEITGLFERVFTVEPETGIKIAIAAGAGHWSYEWDISPRWPGKQIFEAQLSPANYANEIASARTLALRHEIAMAREAGLGLGLTEDSCLIIGPEGYDNQPRFSDEPARHKLLDLLGDLSLAGVPASCLNVQAHKSGHRTNVWAAERLAAHVQIHRVNE